MHSKIIAHVPFNQLWNLSDVKVGGRCFAYAMLFFTYVSIANLSNPQKPIDYSNLVSVLSDIDIKMKDDIQNLQGNCDRLSILNNNIAILNDNESCGDNLNIDEFSQKLLNLIKDTKKPTFYYLSYQDEFQKIFGQEITHGVGIFAASQNEIHFFDSLSGLYILKISDGLTAENFRDDLLQLLFKKNFLMKFSFKFNFNTMYFSIIQSIFTNEIPAFKQPLKEDLLLFIHSMVNDGVFPDFDESEIPQVILDHFALNKFVIKKQNENNHKSDHSIIQTAHMNRFFLQSSNDKNISVKAYHHKFLSSF